MLIKKPREPGCRNYFSKYSHTVSFVCKKIEHIEQNRIYVGIVYKKLNKITIRVLSTLWIMFCAVFSLFSNLLNNCDYAAYSMQIELLIQTGVDFNTFGLNISDQKYKSFLEIRI